MVTTDLIKALEKGLRPYHELEDEETWLVLSDLLQELDDPRGILISIEHSIMHAEGHRRVELEVSRDLHLQEHLEELLFEGAEKHRPGFRWGYLMEIDAFSREDVDLIRSRPCAALVRLIYWRERDWDPPYKKQWFYDEEIAAGKSPQSVCLETCLEDCEYLACLGCKYYRWDEEKK